MTWNYRIGKQTIGEETLYGVVEYYNTLNCWTDFVSPVAESPEDLIQVLEWMLKDVKKNIQIQDFIDIE